MRSGKGYYSVLQYCPDAARCEAANIGVLLCCPEMQFARVRIAEGNDRIRRFFGLKGDELVRVDLLKRSLERRVNDRPHEFLSADAIEAFAATRANELRLSHPRPMRVADPEQALDALYRDLVGGRAEAPRKAREPFVREIDRLFDQPRFQGKVSRNTRITVPVLGTELHVPVAYTNGSLNYVVAQEFSQGPRKATDKAKQLATEGTLVQQVPVGGMETRVVIACRFGPECGRDTPGLIQNMFGALSLRSVDADGLPAFADEVERQLRGHG